MQPEFKIGQFTGFRPVEPAPSDYVAGGETGIVAAVRNDAGDWRPEVPTPKNQLMKVRGIPHGDTNCCTDFSGTNAVAIQLEWLMEHGQLDPNAVTWLHSNGYFDQNGKLNFSPRFTAVMSGTTPGDGNTLPNVWSSMRRDGLVPDVDWPMPVDAFASIVDSGGGLPELWQAYFAAIPDSLKTLGRQFKSWFDIQYEWVAWPGNDGAAIFPDLLKTAPIQIATAVCGGWNNGATINGCGAGTAHATVLLNVEPGGVYDIFDHYSPYVKQFAPNYVITYGMRGAASVKPQVLHAQPPFVHDYQTTLHLGAPASADVRALQQGLQSVPDKAGNPYMKPGVFGPYGSQTELALGRFQVDHGIADAPQGADFGPQSRVALTQALKELAASKGGEPLARPLNPDASHQH